MYESFFEFRQRPFSSAPRVDRYFPAASIESARQTLARCIERAEGPGLIIGPAGSGKSLLCNALAEAFRQRFHVVLLNNAQICTRRALLQNILFELDLPYRAMEEGELRLSMIDFLEPGQSSRDGMLLIVDEAHTLPLRLIEEIRMITNLVRDGQPRVRLVIAGGPILEERFASPKLESFNQRIAARCYLQPLTYEETLSYVRAQVAAVGGDPAAVFADDALHAVFQATHGIPRLINQTCDHALVLAAAGRHRRLHAAGIQEAWADLQQLPVPWNEPLEAGRAIRGVVEYGELADSDRADGDDYATAGNSSPDDLADLHPADDHELRDLARQLDALELKLAAVETGEPTPPSATAKSHAAKTSSATKPSPVEHRGAARGERKTQPAPAILALPAADPFGKDFEHEEIVVDRYATLLAEAGMADSADSTDLLSIFDASQSVVRNSPTAVKATPTATAAEPHEPAKKNPPAKVELHHADNSNAKSPPLETPPAAFHDHSHTSDDAADIVPPGEAACHSSAGLSVVTESRIDVALIRDRGDTGDDDEFASGRSDRHDPRNERVVAARVIRVPPPDDSDMIVIVDDAMDKHRPNPDGGPAPRQEYRRLFSKLRQG